MRFIGSVIEKLQRHPKRIVLSGFRARTRAPTRSLRLGAPAASVPEKDRFGCRWSFSMTLHKSHVL